MHNQSARLLRGWLIGIALLLAILAAFPGTMAARAADQPVKLGIRPVGVAGSYFALTMSPGETRQLTVELSNFGQAPVEARTYAADAYTLVSGGLGARLAGEPAGGTTRWLDYAPQTLTLESGQKVMRTFSVTVPSDAKPGEYLTTVAIQNTTPVVVGTNSNIALQQILRQVVAVSIDIPGPRLPALSITGVAHKLTGGKSVVSFQVENPGNVRLKPAGEFTLRDRTGTEISRAPVTMDTVYAGTATTLEVPLAQALNPGDYSASLGLTDASTGVKAASGWLPFSVARAAVTGQANASSAQPVQVAQRALERVAAPDLWLLVVQVAAVIVVLTIAALLLARRRMRSDR